jgi:hypothetical protein
MANGKDGNTKAMPTQDKQGSVNSYDPYDGNITFGTGAQDFKGDKHSDTLSSVARSSDAALDVFHINDYDLSEVKAKDIELNKLND